MLKRWSHELHELTASCQLRRLIDRYCSYVDGSTLLLLDHIKTHIQSHWTVFWMLLLYFMYSQLRPWG